MSLDHPLGYILGKTKRVYSTRLSAKFKENNVDLCMGLYVLLVLIDLNKVVSQQELADHLQTDKSVVMRQINALMERGYVVRSADKQDRRKKNLVLTQKGYEVLKHTKSLALSVSEELLAGVKEEDQHVFEQVIHSILKNGGSEEDIL